MYPGDFLLYYSADTKISAAKFKSVKPEATKDPAKLSHYTVSGGTDKFSSAIFPS